MHVILAGGWSGRPLQPPRRAEDEGFQGEMVMLPGSVAWSPALSVTLMVNLNVPAARKAGQGQRPRPAMIIELKAWP